MADSSEGGLRGGVEAVRGLVGRWPDAETVLQGGMSDGLRDWDLWYVTTTGQSWHVVGADNMLRGPLLFCLLLSFLLSLNARDDQRSLVFSGVFATVWLGEAIVTLQIKLLGGNMYVTTLHPLCYPHFVLLTLLTAPSSNPSA